MKSLARSMETFDRKVTDYKKRLVEYAKELDKLHKELIKLNEFDIYVDDVHEINEVIKAIKNRRDCPRCIQEPCHCICK
jgi:hypothetical protein